MNEAQIVLSDHVLVTLGGAPGIDGFGGRVLTGADPVDLTGKTVYLRGDPADAKALDLTRAARVFVVADRAGDVDPRGWPVVDPGRVPVLVHGVGVFVRRFFDPAVDTFAQICAEHAFQRLTESTKPGQAHRTGIYLTPVDRVGDELRFHLLRCSTNLSGPTENFRATDRRIVEALNHEARWLFEGAAPLNHVLAQIYHNTPAADGHRQTKAKIHSHADKTKDMPRNGIMAFCTFYDADADGDQLTRLGFRLKPEVAQRPGCTLPERFTVALHPNSVFFLPLSTNRAYTHEIRPSSLDAGAIPTRLGYVVRCSARPAVHRDGHTWIEAGGTWRPLEPPTDEGMAELRAKYADENRTDAPVDYGDRFPFSMNAGDYLAPAFDPADGFPVYALPPMPDPYRALSDGVRFEAFGRGREATVLVRPGPRGTPIVRTTTRYAHPAGRLGPAHDQLARWICAAASLPHPFDNALIERYTAAYATMGAHSDQAQDLEPGSSIAVYSCYAHPDRATPRVLVVGSKERAERFEIPLAHHHVVVFTLDTNRRYRHRIVLGRGPGGPDDDWLGLTLRRSRTFVHHRDGAAYLGDGSRLRLADEAEERALIGLRGRENRELDFVYPELPFTLSPSDLVPPASS